MAWRKGNRGQGRGRRGVKSGPTFSLRLVSFSAAVCNTQWNHSLQTLEMGRQTSLSGQTLEMGRQTSLSGQTLEMGRQTSLIRTNS